MWTSKLNVVAVALLGLPLLATLHAHAAHSRTTLRWRFKEGDKLNYVIEQKTLRKFYVMGVEIPQTNEQFMEFVWDVESVDGDGTATISQTITSYRETARDPFGQSEYDSKKYRRATDWLMGESYDAIVGTTFKLKMNQQGEVMDVTLPKKLHGVVREALRRNPTFAHVGGVFSEEGIRLVAKSGIVLPKDEISEGDSWETEEEHKVSMEATSVGTANVTSTFKYEGPEDRGGLNVERVAIRGRMNVRLVPDAPAELKIKSQDVKGIAYFDNERGCLVEIKHSAATIFEISGGGHLSKEEIEMTGSMTLITSMRDGS